MVEVEFEDYGSGFTRVPCVISNKVDAKDRICVLHNVRIDCLRRALTDRQHSSKSPRSFTCEIVRAGTRSRLTQQVGTAGEFRQMMLALNSKAKVPPQEL